MKLGSLIVNVVIGFVTGYFAYQFWNGPEVYVFYEQQTAQGIMMWGFPRFLSLPVSIGITLWCIAGAIGNVFARKNEK